MQDDSLVYVPIKDLSEVLNTKVTTLRSWVKAGTIPKSTYIKAGNTYRFCVPQVIAALQGEPPEDTTPIGLASSQDFDFDTDIDEDI